MLLPPAGALLEGVLVLASAANLCGAFQYKNRQLHYVGVAWLSLCSCQDCRVHAPPRERGCSVVQHLVVTYSADKRCSLQKDLDFVVLA